MALKKLKELVTPVVLVDTNGVEYNASGGGGGSSAIDDALSDNGDVLPQKAIAIGGTDGADLHTIRTDSSGFLQLGSSESFIGSVGGIVANPTANFTRPADTPAYASGDLVANSTTAGSVAAMTLTIMRIAAGSCILRRIKLHKSGTSTTNASFRVHFFRAAPATITNGDNGVFSVSGVADYLGAMDVTMDRAFTDGAVGFGVPMIGSEMSIKLASGTTVRALIEARGAYTPISGEVFTLTIDDLQD